MPQNWKTYKLEDALECLIDYRGKTPKKTTSGIPLVTAKIVKKGVIQEPKEFIAESDYKGWMIRGFPEIGDVVLTTEAPLGEVAIIKDKHIALAQRIITLRGKKGILSSSYLKYFLQSTVGQNRLVARESGTTVTGIKQSELRKLKVDCPSYEEQTAIANILSTIDAKIENNLAINKTLEEMAMALYKEWFVDFGSFQESDFAESDLGMIPAGWEVRTLRDFIDLNPRLSIRKGESKTFAEMKILPIDCMSVSQVVKKEFKGGSKFQNGDTLFARITPCLENGKTAYVDFLIDKEIGFGSTEFLVMRAKKNISKYWVYCISRDPNFRNFSISTMVGTSGRQRVQNEPFLSYEIAKPPLEYFTNFDKKVESYFKQIRQGVIENQTLTKLRDTLLPKLISGEVRLKEFDLETELKR
ncbi:restriction endonuclease subunit S [Patiriisocius marinus]|uniref:restriction endonuclease subunit S n=1 Tax=Patiriisocius marinus TaxID=1397112 RepID=UPI00233120FD|nr:restriction endonuclease subunit S [Patiriisocius marinus]